jgi:hypothetical protein
MRVVLAGESEIERGKKMIKKEKCRGMWAPRFKGAFAVCILLRRVSPCIRILEWPAYAFL